MKSVPSSILALCLLAISGAAWGAPACTGKTPDETMVQCSAAIQLHTPQRGTFPEVLAADYGNRAIGYEGKGMLQEALADYEQSVELKPDFVTLFNRGNFLIEHADTRRGVEDLGEAIRRYEGGSRPQQAEWTEGLYRKALSQRADALRRLGRNAEAVVDYTKAAGFKPDDDTLLFNRALAYSSSEQYDAAIADLDKVLEKRRRQGNDVGALSNRGIVYMKKGDYPRAIADMDEVIRREGNSPYAYARRAAVWEKAGQRDKAVVDYRQALQLYANLPEARDGLKRLGAE
jgi:tetratricopeptide (TPR) repeat protein